MARDQLQSQIDVLAAKAQIGLETEGFLYRCLINGIVLRVCIEVHYVLIPPDLPISPVYRLFTRVHRSKVVGFSTWRRQGLGTVPLQSLFLGTTRTGVTALRGACD